VTRVRSPDRVLGDKSKLADPGKFRIETRGDGEGNLLIINPFATAVLQDLVSNNKLLNPHDESLGYDFGLNLQLQHISIDTTELKPEESALRILDIVALRNDTK
jgi:hypothetical protein